MAKQADMFIETDPWIIREKGWHADKNQVAESLFSLANEYQGVRGYAEEGVLGAECLLGVYFNGIYDYAKTAEPPYKGIVDKTHFMVNSVNWLWTQIEIDGKQISMSDSVTDSVRELDLRTGLFRRCYSVVLSEGRTFNLSFERFLDRSDVRLGWQRITVAYAGSGAESQVTLSCGLDFDVWQTTRKAQFWTVTDRHSEAEPATAGIAAVTSISRQTVTSKSRISVSAPGETTAAVIPFSEEKRVGHTVHAVLQPGQRLVIEKQVSNSHGSEDATLSSDTFAAALARQKVYWDGVWSRSDIELEGDPVQQQGIRFCIFQMQQTYSGVDGRNNIGAKGLTGEAYNGHAFWDTETCCFPFYLFSNMQAAKNLLEYRYTTLPQAKERARMLDCRGACYPIATLNGEEGCNLWQHASLQFQPTSAVAYAIAQYYTYSGDRSFLFGHGIEMLIECSRCLYSRGSWNQDHTGFGLYGVMGPDEFHMMENNNFYTNFMVQKTFNYTLQTLEQMKQTAPDRYDAVVQATGFSADEAGELQRASDKMILLYDPATELFEQQEGYFGLPHINVNEIPVTDFPLYSNWSYDRIYRTDMVKQPDVLMAMYLYPSLFTKNQLEANYRYYESRTIHESSLSPAVHSALACRLGDMNDAERFFGFATRLDLDNYNRNTSEGLHITSIAMTWTNIVLGFGGVSCEPQNTCCQTLSLAPVIPDGWKSYRFSLVFAGVGVQVTVTKETVTVTRREGTGSLELSLYGSHFVLDESPVTVPQGGRK
ncbi:MAG: family 65 glycosyl hydrolase [Treponemataceae bacterium]|nr:family 65 glycosyl hydrolase [Treponemataceae bacterium]